MQEMNEEKHRNRSVVTLPREKNLKEYERAAEAGERVIYKCRKLAGPHTYTHTYMHSFPTIFVNATL